MKGVGLVHTLIGRSQPDAEFTYASSGTQASPDTMRFTLSGKNGGEQMQIDWGDGTFETLNLNTSRQDFSHDYTAAGDFNIKFFSADDKIASLDCTQKGGLKFNVDNLPEGINNQLIIKNTGAEGSLASPKIKDVLLRCNISNTKVQGSTADIPIIDPTSSSRFIATNCDISGPLNDIPGKEGRRYILNNTQVDGVTADCNNFPNTIPQVASTNVTGPIKDLRSFGDYNFNNCTLNGDLKDAAELKASGFLRFKNVGISTYTSTTDWGSGGQFYDINFSDNNLSSSEVDQILIDLDNAGTKGRSLRLAGSNAPRTSNSDTAVSNLQSRGFSINVNT